MSAEYLSPLQAPLDTVPGIGPRLASLLARLVGDNCLRDLLFHLPVDFTDRRPLSQIKDCKAGAISTLRVEVIRIEPPARKSQPHRIVIGDGTGFAEIILFHAARLVQFPIGAKLLVSGRIDIFADRKVMAHPDIVLRMADEAKFPWVEPVWPLAAGITQYSLRKAMDGALAKLPDLPEWHDAAILRRRHWPGFAQALQALQKPGQIPGPQAHERLAYDELLARQLAFALSRRHRRRRPGRPLIGNGALRAQALQLFGYQPTKAQAGALGEIDADLAKPQQMLRLLQGDVGSGKTLVAILAMLRAVEAGAQAAFLAPTEILARQHLAVLRQICPVKVAFLSGSIKGRPRAEILAGLAGGSIPILVGTHAIFQKPVAFKNLSLAVIDEQHKFGVDQRLALSAKGQATDMLVMTATPIPRSLLLTHWGEMDISRIAEKPAGRAPITTTLHKLSELATVIAGLGRVLAGPAQIYWVCPLVSESELLDITAAQMRFEHLREIFGAQVVLAHGQMKPAARDAALADFAAGRARILVATTIIEVGVDVKAANIMVIEHAERFGLAQLHQLRGRVGRGAAKSFCLLLHTDKISQAAKSRLRFLQNCQDGFLIADEDYRLRGAGEALGTKQSGLPGYRLADHDLHENLQVMAAQDAELILQRDPKLEALRGTAIKLLLNLFGQREAINTLRAG